MGLIHEAARTGTGRHLFDDRALRRVEIIKELNATGYPLRDIKDIYFRGNR
jgi:DNA-binding transcriptional MerR regulator